MTTTEHQPAWVPASLAAERLGVKLQTVLSWADRGHTTRNQHGHVDFRALDRYLRTRPTTGTGSGFKTGDRRTIDDE